MRPPWCVLWKDLSSTAPPACASFIAVQQGWQRVSGLVGADPGGSHALSYSLLSILPAHNSSRRPGPARVHKNQDKQCCFLFFYYYSFIRQFRCSQNRLSWERRQTTSDKGPPVKRGFCLATCAYKWNSQLNGTGQGENKFSLIYTLHKTVLGSQMLNWVCKLLGRQYSYTSSCLWEWHTWTLWNAKISPAFHIPAQKGDIGCNKPGI